MITRKNAQILIMFCEGLKPITFQEGQYPNLKLTKYSSDRELKKSPRLHRLHTKDELRFEMAHNKIWNFIIMEYKVSGKTLLGPLQLTEKQAMVNMQWAVQMIIHTLLGQRHWSSKVKIYENIDHLIWIRLQIYIWICNVGAWILLAVVESRVQNIILFHACKFSKSSKWLTMQSDLL